MISKWHWQFTKHKDLALIDFCMSRCSCVKFSRVPNICSIQGNYAHIGNFDKVFTINPSQGGIWQVLMFLPKPGCLTAGQALEFWEPGWVVR